ncbi:MAG: hypothetical protein U0359_27970 [Byssovorax sp.]
MIDPASPDPRHLCPYVVATSAVAAHLDLAPLGQLIAPEHTFDPLLRASAPFLHRVEQLDDAEYTPQGMAMPRWALYDCAELPGLICGLGEPGDEGLRPLSMMLAVPMLGERRWLVYSIASPQAHLRFATLALGLGLIRAGEINATLQWSSPELPVYAHFAPLTLRAARLLSHDVPATCMIRFEVDPDRIEHAIADTDADPPGAEVLDVRDHAVLDRLAHAIEEGREVQIVGHPRREDNALLVPLSIGGRA